MVQLACRFRCFPCEDVSERRDANSDPRVERPADTDDLPRCDRFLDREIGRACVDLPTTLGPLRSTGVRGEFTHATREKQPRTRQSPADLQPP